MFYKSNFNTYTNFYTNNDNLFTHLKNINNLYKMYHNRNVYKSFGIVLLLTGSYYLYNKYGNCLKKLILDKIIPTKNLISNDNNPFICKFYNQSSFTLKITGGTTFPGQNLSPPKDTKIANNNHYDYCIFTSIEITVIDSSGNPLGKGDIVIKTDTQGNQYLLDKTNTILFTYDPKDSEYPDDDPWDQRHAMKITTPSILVGPPIISNAWNSGMLNNLTKPEAENSFWLQDYGMNEEDRWSVNGDAICQNTKLVGTNVGSRSYPAYLSTGTPTWNINNSPPYAPGIAFNGCWQISMKCGSTRNESFCETFYLAERAEMSPGSQNYQDGSGTASGGNSREIDIMETRWNPDGPQSNCPNGGGTEWSSQWSNQQMGKWSDVGGLPMEGFVTFGCLIRDNNLWIYGYKQDGSSWFSSDAVIMNNTLYQQKNPFAVYIGTWSDQQAVGGFSTCYKDFIYLRQDEQNIAGKNPKDNPESFGIVLNKIK